MRDEDVKITIHHLFDLSSGEVVDELLARSPDATEEPSMPYMLSDMVFTACLATMLSYAEFASEMQIDRLFDFPEDGVYKRDILNIVSAFLEEDPEFRAQPLTKVMLAALIDFYNPRN